MSRLPAVPMTLLLAPLLAAGGCELVSPYLEEQRTSPDFVYWTGTVLDGPFSEDAGVFTGGVITVTDPSGQPLLNDDGEALEAPYEVEGEPGGWVLFVPIETEVVLHLSGEGFVNTVWSARTPSGRGYWYSGALFARRVEAVDATLEVLAEAGLIGDSYADLADGAAVHLWAEPQDPDAWVGASFAVVDSEGLGEVIALTVAEDGVVSRAGPTDPVSLILALDLAPGAVTFEAATPDGRHVLLPWLAEGGDLLNASFLTLSGE